MLFDSALSPRPATEDRLQGMIDLNDLLEPLFSKPTRFTSQTFGRFFI